MGIDKEKFNNVNNVSDFFEVGCHKILFMMLLKVLRGLWFYCWGHLFALFFYEKKYLKGRWFSGRLGGLCAIGWEWVCYSAVARILLGHNSQAKFPVSSRCTVNMPENIDFNPDNLDNFQSFGIYYQALGKIVIGEGTFIGPNVGIITANHDPLDLKKHLEPSPVIIGKNCWIGMNAVILPGVILGDNTIVGAGSVVTKSFLNGGIIAGNPARLISNVNE